jgi:hypothetical protein
MRGAARLASNISPAELFYELKEPSKSTSNGVSAGTATILIAGTGSGLGAGVWSAALLTAGAVTDESASGGAEEDEHETIPKPSEVSRIPVNTYFIEILLVVSEGCLA